LENTGNNKQKLTIRKTELSDAPVLLTLIKELAVYDMKNKTHDFSDVFNSALLKAKEALENTPNQLKVLHDAHVVDAGAKGFVHLLEGMAL